MDLILCVNQKSEREKAKKKETKWASHRDASVKWTRVEVSEREQIGGLVSGEKTERSHS